MINTLIISILLISIGLLFFIGGTIGAIRFPDLNSKLHALTKADNLGLGFTVAGIAVYFASPWEAFKLILIWAVLIMISASVSYIIAHESQEKENE